MSDMSNNKALYDGLHLVDEYVCLELKIKEGSIYESKISMEDVVLSPKQYAKVLKKLNEIYKILLKE